MRAIRLVGGVAAIAIAIGGCARCGDEQPLPKAPPACLEDRTIHPGEATYYDGDGRGACSFEPAVGEPLIAAIGKPDYGSACGACIAVTGPKGTVTVRVVDSCPGCDPGDLDLSRAAFARIASPDAGRVKITWRYVGCDVEGPLRYRFKDRSNASWTGVQVRNHRHGIARFELRGADGTYREIRRASYNYFVDSKGFGPGPYTFRITDARGLVLADADIALDDSREQPGAAQALRCQ